MFYGSPPLFNHDFSNLEVLLNMLAMTVHQELWKSWTYNHFEQGIQKIKIAVDCTDITCYTKRMGFQSHGHNPPPFFIISSQVPLALFNVMGIEFT